MAYVYETSEQLQQLKHNSMVSKRISKEILSQSSGGPRRSQQATASAASNKSRRRVISAKNTRYPTAQHSAAATRNVLN